MTINQAMFLKAVAKWHSRLAVIIAIWLVLLALSGILINHAHDWGLDHKPLPAPLQHWVYDIESNGEDFCNTLTASGVACGAVFARLQLPVGDLLLDENSLFLLDEAGQLVEKLAVSQLGLRGLHAGLRIGTQIYLQDSEKTVVTDTELLNHAPVTAEAVAALNGSNWQVRSDSAQSITWERLFLDLHAMRFLGPLAKIINDLMAVLILILAISGLWLYRLKVKANGNQ